MTFKPIKHALVALLLTPVFIVTQAANAHEDDEDGAADPKDLTAAQEEIVDVLNLYAAAMEAANFDAIEALAFNDDSFSSFEGAHLDIG